MCRVLHKYIFKTLATNKFRVRNFVQFVLEVDVRHFCCLVFLQPPVEHN